MPSNPFFRFKQFIVHQDKTAMKVGTDGVLLGSIVGTIPCTPFLFPQFQSPNPTVLDIGTGTGLIALMMAQRLPQAKVTAIDIDPDAVTQATDNVAQSPFASQICVLQTDIRHLPTQRFNIIVSNPPYFVQSLTCPSDQRTTARHVTDFDHRELVNQIARLLAPNGLAAIILPHECAPQIDAYARQVGLAIVSQTNIFTTKRKPAKRVVLQLVWQELIPEMQNCLLQFANELPISTDVILLQSDDSMSVEYKELCRDFYLDSQN